MQLELFQVLDGGVKDEYPNYRKKVEAEKETILPDAPKVETKPSNNE